MSERKDHIKFDMDCTATNGVVIPMKINISYPKGYGFYAAKALQMLPENMDDIWADLVSRQDRSTLEVMGNSGHYVADDDDEL